MINSYSMGMILLSSIIMLILYQLIATKIDEYRYPPIGKLVDIGGYKLHLNSSGSNGTTVVLEPGLGGTSLGWALVQREVEKFAHVCSYDRAGYAWSNASPLKRTSKNIAEELHNLLHKAQMPPPYVLVGHSFGGSNVLMFADLYPEETAGVILVDAVHEDLVNENFYSDQTLWQGFYNQPTVQWLLSASGFNRLKGPSEEIRLMFNPLPEKIRANYLVQMNKNGYAYVVAQEKALLKESLKELALRKIHLNQIPLIVITAGRGTSKSWQQFQKKFLSKSHYAKQILADQSDHMINHHQPDRIVEAIRELVRSFKNKSEVINEDF